MYYVHPTPGLQPHVEQRGQHLSTALKDLVVKSAVRGCSRAVAIVVGWVHDETQN